MIYVILLVLACHSPQHTTCVGLAMVNMTARGPIACQLARIPISHFWRYQVQVVQGHKDWAVFTQCDLIKEPKS